MKYPHIATPSYSNTVTSYYLQTFMELNRLEIPFSYNILHGDSLVTRVRNSLFSEYVANRNIRGNTHLLWVDDDIGFEPEGMVSLLKHDVDVCGMAVPLRRHDRSYGITCAVEGALEEVSPRFYKVSRLGCGVMMWSNAAVDSIVEYCRDNDLVYNNTSNSDMEFFDVFQVGSNNGYYLSEDYVACEILKFLGYEIYVDSSAGCIHSQPNDSFVRPAMDIDKRSFSGKPRDPLPKEDRDKFWAPADHVLGLIK